MFKDFIKDSLIANEVLNNQISDLKLELTRLRAENLILKERLKSFIDEENGCPKEH